MTRKLSPKPKQNRARNVAPIIHKRNHKDTSTIVAHANSNSSKMRRAQGYNYQPLSQSGDAAGGNDMLEEENERLEAELQGKIGALKSLTIDIGHEVRYQDKVLRGIDDDMDRTGGFLGNTMSRVVRLGRNGHQGYMCYMFLFVVFVFFVLYITLKLRG